MTSGSRIGRYTRQTTFIRAFETFVENNQRTPRALHDLRALQTPNRMSRSLVGTMVVQPALDRASDRPGSLGHAVTQERARDDISLVIDVIPPTAEASLHDLSATVRELLPVLSVLLDAARSPRVPYGYGLVHGFVEAQYPTLWPYAIDVGAEACRLSIHDVATLTDAEEWFWRGWILGQRAEQIAEVDWAPLFDLDVDEVRTRLGIDADRAESTFRAYFQTSHPPMTYRTDPREFLVPAHPLHDMSKTIVELGRWRSLNFMFQREVSDEDFAGITFSTYLDEVHMTNVITAVEADELSARALHEQWSNHFDGEYPEGSLGAVYRQFTEKNDISPYYSKSTAIRSPYDYVWMRIFNTHDLCHVVGDVGIKPVEEAFPFAFLRAQIPAFSTAAYIVGVGILRLIARGSYDGFDVAARGWITGRLAAPMFGADWESLMELPIDEARKLLGVDPAAVESAMVEIEVCP